MRSAVRLALLALCTALVSSTTALAQTELRASDGQDLGMQSPSTQAEFTSTWGADAAARWILEHNAALASGPDYAAVPVTSAVPVKPVLIIMNDKDQFEPAMLRVPLGTPVTWRNDDTDPHTVTGDPARSMPGIRVVAPTDASPWDSGLVDAGKSYTHTFQAVGHYIYICTIHAGKGMVATLDVTG
jgi:plastocyanin